MDPPTAASGSKGGEITVEVVPPTPEPMVVDSPAVKIGAEKTVPTPSHSSGLAVLPVADSSNVKAAVPENTTAST